MVISFSNSEMGHVARPHEGELVVIAEIHGYDMKRVVTTEINGYDMKRL